MLDKILHFRYQILLWILVVASLGTNAYLIASQPEFDYPSYDDAMLDIAEAEVPDAEAIASNSVAAAGLQELETPVVPITKLFEAKGGEPISKLLQTQHRVSKLDADKIQQLAKKHLARGTLVKGDKVKVELIADASGSQQTPRQIVIESDEHKLELTLGGDNKTYIAKKTTLPTELKTKLIAGTINGSIYSSARKAGADAKLIKEFINLLSYNVDFQRDVKNGDYFRIFYEYTSTQNNSKQKKPQIVYASLSSAGEEHEVYRYKLANGAIDYFSADGQSVRKALLRTPINGAKVSSNFGMRIHPVHGYSQMHKGVDFSAPRGTPILAAGDGVIRKVSSQGRGYGNFVEIEHNRNYGTLYAHMSRFASGIRPGTHVRQGQVIGYVGATGTATGPHLHFEVIKDGVKINPAKASFPKSNPLTGTELAKFKKNIQRIETVVASADDSAPRRVASLDRTNVSKIPQAGRSTSAKPKASIKSSSKASAKSTPSKKK